MDAYYANHSANSRNTLTSYLSAGPRDGAFGLNIAHLGNESILPKNKYLNSTAYLS